MYVMFANVTNHTLFIACSHILCYNVLRRCIIINIGKYIESLRIKHGFKSQRQLAIKSNISPATLSRIEAGLQKPNLETLKAIADHLPSTTYKELMRLGGYPTTGEDQQELIGWKERAITAESEVSRLNGLIDKLVQERGK